MGRQKLRCRLLPIIVIFFLIAVPAQATSVLLLRGEQCADVYGGSGTCYDRAISFYGALGYTGTLYDREMAYLGDMGYTGTLGDRWRTYLSGFGGGLSQKVREFGNTMRGLTFYAPFANPGTPLGIGVGTGSLSFTRATPAWREDYSEAASGVLRVGAKGAWIEGQRTNLKLWSDNYSSGSVGYNPGGTIPSITNDVAVSPDGSTTADRISFSAMGTTTNVRYSQFTTSAQAYVGSVYLKVATGTASVSIFLYSDTGPVGTETICNLTTTWQRFYVTSTMPVSTDSFFSIGYDTRNPPNGQAQVGTPSILAWGAQVEVGAFPSSYIPTVAAAVTRNKDDLTVQTSGNISAAAGTLAVEWTPKFASTAAVGSPVLWDAGGLKTTYTAADDKLNFTDGTNTVSTAAMTFSSGDTLKLAFRWGAGGLDIYKDGAEAATGATYTAPALNANLYIGSDVSAANHAFSIFKNDRVWNREFADAEMVAVTR